MHHCTTVYCSYILPNSVLSRFYLPICRHRRCLALKCGCVLMLLFQGGPTQCPINQFELYSLSSHVHNSVSRICLISTDSNLFDCCYTASFHTIKKLGISRDAKLTIHAKEQDCGATSAWHCHRKHIKQYEEQNAGGKMR